MPKLEKLSAFKSKVVVAAGVLGFSAVSAMADVTYWR